MTGKKKGSGRWYQNAAVLAAAVGGAFAVLAAVVGGVLSLVDSSGDTRTGGKAAAPEFNVTVLLDQAYVLPRPGALVELSGPSKPPTLQGIRLDADDPYHIDFIVDKGDVGLDSPELADAVERLVRYFLTALCLPENELWVNLSPYEAERIIPDRFGRTRMGRDFLAQDYLLKQVASSLTHPESDIGREYWQTVYRIMGEELGATDLKVNTFNKVWIVPKDASVYLKSGTAVITGATLEVLTEEDYLATKESSTAAPEGAETRVAELASRASREILIPHLSREVNTGSNFGLVRQAFSALILATWYKRTLRDSLLTQYVNARGDVLVDGTPDFAAEVYDRFLAGYKKGVFNFIREDYDPETQEMIPRKYYSGGITALGLGDKIADRGYRRRLTVGVLQSAVLLIHVSLFGSPGAEATPALERASDGSARVVEVGEADPGGIDFGVHFDIGEASDDRFAFTREALAMRLEEAALSPQVLDIVAFPNLASLMNGAHRGR